jgi:hypothetical protein
MNPSAKSSFNSSYKNYLVAIVFSFDNLSPNFSKVWFNSSALLSTISKNYLFDKAT